MNLKNKINISLVIFGLLNFLLVAFLIYPLFKAIKNNSQDLISQRSSLASIELKTEKLEEFEDIYPAIQANLEKIPNLFIDSQAPVEFITFLEALSHDCQLLIEISPGASLKPKEDPWPSLSFQISSLGSFPNFLKFLEKLESSPYLIEVKNLSVNRLSETTLSLEELERFASDDIKANLSIKVFTKEQ